MGVTGDAEHIYRERFLRERYGLQAHDVLPARRCCTRPTSRPPCYRGVFPEMRRRRSTGL
jgi:hypothetical protein